MFTVDIMPFATCFLYTSYHFFLGLTYEQDAAAPVPVFCCFWFQKSCSGNILGTGRHESQSPYFAVTHPESEGESKRGSRAATPCGGATLPWPRGHRVWPPWAPTDVALPPIYSFPRENPKHLSPHPRKVLQPPSSSTIVREGSEALPGTLPERGIITGEPINMKG